MCCADCGINFASGRALHMVRSVIVECITPTRWNVCQLLQITCCFQRAWYLGWNVKPWTVLWNWSRGACTCMWGWVFGYVCATSGSTFDRSLLGWFCDGVGMQFHFERGLRKHLQWQWHATFDSHGCRDVVERSADFFFRWEVAVSSQSLADGVGMHEKLCNFIVLLKFIAAQCDQAYQALALICGNLIVIRSICFCFCFRVCCRGI